MSNQTTIDSIDAEAEIDAIMAKAERYERAAQAEYGNLRMYAVLYKYMEATNKAMAALLREYVALCADGTVVQAQMYKDGRLTVSTPFLNRRDELRKRAEELLADE